MQLDSLSEPIAFKLAVDSCDNVMIVSVSFSPSRRQLLASASPTLISENVTLSSGTVRNWRKDFDIQFLSIGFTDLHDSVFPHHDSVIP